MRERESGREEETRWISLEFAGGVSPLWLTRDTVHVCVRVFACLGACVHALEGTGSAVGGLFGE